MLYDNSTACINIFSTSGSLECDSLAEEIWAWAPKANIWLSANHLPREQNFEADLESRKQDIHTEWKLKMSVFQFLCKEQDFSQSIDLFATRINTQLPIFASYRPDPNCFVVNAFLLDWVKMNFYAFLPFACLTKVLKKIHHDRAKEILIAPDWPFNHFIPVQKNFL